MQGKWNGEERRLAKGDHDTLVELVQIIKNHVDNFDVHVTTDDTNFKEMKSDIKFNSKWIYIGMGAISVLQIIGFFHK